MVAEDELLRAEHGKFWYAIQRCQTLDMRLMSMEVRATVDIVVDPSSEARTLIQRWRSLPFVHFSL